MIAMTSAVAPPVAVTADRHPGVDTIPQAKAELARQVAEARVGSADMEARRKRRRIFGMLDGVEQFPANLAE